MLENTLGSSRASQSHTASTSPSPSPFRRALALTLPSLNLPGDSAGLGLATPPPTPPPSPWLVASLAPLFLLPGPRLTFFPSIFSAGAGPQPLNAPESGKLLPGLGLGHGHIQGEVTGPVASQESVAGNPHFLLVLHFLPTLCAPPPPPPWQGLLVLNRACSGCLVLSYPVRGPQLLPLLSESGLGLLAWARLAYFGLFRSIQTSRP